MLSGKNREASLKRVNDKRIIHKVFRRSMYRGGTKRGYPVDKK